MKISRDSLIELRKKLFRGSPKTIRLRLLAKGTIVSTQYISRCLDPDNKRYSQIIIEEAIMLGEENTNQMNQLSQRIGTLNDAI